MKYIIAITFNQHTDYIMDGRSYSVNGEIYVPVTSDSSEAKRYSSMAQAIKGSQRKGANMWGSIEIKEVKE